MIRDRRRGADRREYPRFAVNIEVEWESFIGTQKGTISDISALGCFVLCSGEVEDNEEIKIHVALLGGKLITLAGIIVNHVYEIGFGVRFVELGENEKLFLEKLLAKLQERADKNEIEQK